MLNINFNIVQIGCGYWGTNIAKTFNRLGSLSHLCDENIKRNGKEMLGIGGKNKTKCK